MTKEKSQLIDEIVQGLFNSFMKGSTLVDEKRTKKQLQISIGSDLGINLGESLVRSDGRQLLDTTITNHSDKIYDAYSKIYDMRNEVKKLKENYSQEAADSLQGKLLNAFKDFITAIKIVVATVKEHMQERPMMNDLREELSKVYDEIAPEAQAKSYSSRVMSSVRAFGASAKDLGKKLAKNVKADDKTHTPSHTKSRGSAVSKA